MHPNLMDLLLMTGAPVFVGVGYLVWKAFGDPADFDAQELPARRREDARDWQRRLGAGSLLATHFLQPTQNEILETLCVLDHLRPGWETGEASQAERRFLNELSLTFPTLRRPGCLFPGPLAEASVAAARPADDPAVSHAREDNLTARREAFRARRAQFTALAQIVGAAPAATSSGNPLFATPRNPHARISVVLLSALSVVAVLLGVHSSPRAVNATAPAPELASMTAPILLPQLPAAAEPSPPATEPVAVARPTPASATAVAPAAATPTATTDRTKAAAFDQQIAASKQRAVSKYPALGIEGSEINLRFVFRYKALVQQNSPRLRDPRWPEQLVEECAAASGVAPKPDAFTRVLGTPR